MEPCYRRTTSNLYMATSQETVPYPCSTHLVTKHNTTDRIHVPRPFVPKHNQTHSHIYTRIQCMQPPLLLCCFAERQRPQERRKAKATRLCIWTRLRGRTERSACPEYVRGSASHHVRRNESLPETLLPHTPNPPAPWRVRSLRKRHPLRAKCAQYTDYFRRIK